MCPQPGNASAGCERGNRDRDARSRNDRGNGGRCAAGHFVKLGLVKLALSGVGADKRLELINRGIDSEALQNLLKRLAALRCLGNLGL